jgi:hypothetical protein
MPANLEHTFVILAYKDSPHLIECIRSLQGQSVKSNIVMITSTPSKFLCDTAARFSMPLFENVDKGGIGADWTFAYKIADTKYVTLAHQDDIYLPGYTHSCLAASRRYGAGELMLFTNYDELVHEHKLMQHSRNLFVKDIVLLPLLFKNGITSGLLKNILLRFGNPISCPTVMFNKHAIGNFEFSRDYVCALDWDAWVRLTRKKGLFVYVNKRLIIHRIYKESQSYIATENKLRLIEERAILSRMWPSAIAAVFAGIHYYVTKPTR